MQENRIDWRYFVLLASIFPATFIVHEFAHWAAGEALGYPMRMSLNAAAPVAGQFASDKHEMWVSAAGPLVTLLQGSIAFALIRAGQDWRAYSFLFAAWMMRFAALMISMVYPNDEARISSALGLGTWTLPVLIVALLTWMLVSAGRKLKIGWRVNILSYLLGSMAIAAIVFLDR